MIQSVKYTSSGTDVSITLETGGVWSTDAALPADVEVRRWLAAWLGQGGVIEPYVAPVVPLPAITGRQLCMALLLEWGITEEDVAALIANIPDPLARDLADIEWRRGDIFLRDNPLITQIGASLGKTEAQINTAWAIASGL